MVSAEPELTASVFLVVGSHTGVCVHTHTHTHTHTDAQFKNGKAKLSDFRYSWTLQSVFRSDAVLQPSDQTQRNQTSDMKRVCGHAAKPIH